MEFSGIFLYRWNNIWKSICSVVYYNCVSRCCLDGVHQLWKGAQLDRLLCGLMNYWWCGSIAICANNWDNNATWSLFGGGRSAALPPGQQPPARAPESTTIMSRSAQWLVSYPNSKIDSLSLEFFPKSLLARITAKVNTAVIIGTFMDQ